VPSERETTQQDNVSHADDVTFVIRSLTSGTELAVLRMPPSSTIDAIKTKLFVTDGTPKGQQRFVLDGRVLDSEESLIGLGLPAELSFVKVQWKIDEEVFETGDLVQLHYNGNVVADSLAGTRQEWCDSMNEMLGRTFTVMEVPWPGCVSLPSPTDCVDGDIFRGSSMVTFPDCVVRKGEVLALGDIVRMSSSKESVCHSFQSCGYVWHHLMKGMLGKEFTILDMTSQGIIALASPDGSQNGKWYFPVSVVSKVTGDHEEVVRRTQ